MTPDITTMTIAFELNYQVFTHIVKLKKKPFYVHSKELISEYIAWEDSCGFFLSSFHLRNTFRFIALLQGPFYLTATEPIALRTSIIISWPQRDHCWVWYRNQGTSKTSYWIQRDQSNYSIIFLHFRVIWQNHIICKYTRGPFTNMDYFKTQVRYVITTIIKCEWIIYFP